MEEFWGVPRKQWALYVVIVWLQLAIFIIDCLVCDSGVLTEDQLTSAVKTLCSVVHAANDKVVCGKAFRCLAVQSLPKHIVTAQVNFPVMYHWHLYCIHCTAPFTWLQAVGNPLGFHGIGYWGPWLSTVEFGAKQQNLVCCMNELSYGI